MTSEGLGEMFEGDSAGMCDGKFPLVSMGGGAEVLACAYPVARTPIDASGNCFYFCGTPHSARRVESLSCRASSEAMFLQK